MFNTVKRLFNNVKKCMASEELFYVDRSFMNMFGVWSSNKKFNYKMISITLLLIVFSFVPQCNFLRKAIANKDNRSITLSIPEIIYFCLSILTILNFLYNENLFSELVQKIEIEWKKSLLTKNPEWMIIQTKIVKSSNLMSASFKILIYSCYILYCVVPYCIFIVKYNFLGNDVFENNLTLIE